jgi:hypothetical protein
MSAVLCYAQARALREVLPYIEPPLCYAMPCYAMLCYAMPCYAMEVLPYIEPGAER